jgi:ABC-type transporter Mla subunit MlaD
VRYLGRRRQVVHITIDPDSAIACWSSPTSFHGTIDQRTRASLGLQGITGLLFIDLKRDSTPRRGGAGEGINYPVIRSAPSDFDVL